MAKRGQEKSRKASISLGFTAFIGIAMASEHSVFITPIVIKGIAAKARTSRAAAE